MGQFISFKSKMNNPWFNPWFILLHTHSNVCVTVEGRCLEYLECITLLDVQNCRTYLYCNKNAQKGQYQNLKFMNSSQWPKYRPLFYYNLDIFKFRALYKSKKSQAIFWLSRYLHTFFSHLIKYLLVTTYRATFLLVFYVNSVRSVSTIGVLESFPTNFYLFTF